MMDVEDQVRTALRAVPRVDGPDDLGLVAAAVDRRRRRRQSRGAQAGALALVLALVGGALVLRQGDGPGGLEVAAPTVTSGTWRSLPAGPLSPRFQQQSVWTGREVVVAGGCGVVKDDGCGNREAAAYDPAARTWRRIADLPGGGDNVLVAAGDQVVLVTGQTSPRSWIWDPDDDSWRSLGPVPLSGVASSGTYLTWTGTEVLAVGQFGAGDSDDTGRGGSSGPVARLDLASGQWRTGAAAPPMPIFGDAVWTGAELVVAGALDASGSSIGRGAVVAYDPLADRWRALPEPPGGQLGAVGWSGRELVMSGIDTVPPGGVGPDLLSPPHRAAALDLTTGRWRALPDAPIAVRGQDRYREPVAAGRLVLRGPEGQLVTLDPATGEWAVGSAPPLVRNDAPLIWTGTEAIVWGGGTHEKIAEGASSCCTPVAGGESTPLP